MEKKQRSLFMNSLVYGLITGGGLILFSLLLYIMDAPYKSPLGYLGIVIMIGGMIWGTIQHKNVNMNGYLSYGQAFLSCFLIAIIATALSSVYTYLFYTFFDPQALANIIDKAVEEAELKMESQGMSSDQMDAALGITKKFLSPVAMSLMGLVMNSIFGAIIALIAAAFLKKEENVFQS